MNRSAVAIGGLLLLGAGACGSSGGGGNCTRPATCGAVLSASMLMTLQPMETGYMESNILPCTFSLPSSSGGIFQVFCGDAALLETQRATAEAAYPGAVTETDTIGMKSFEQIVGPAMMSGSYAEVNALTTNGKYVFNVSLNNAYADITQTRPLASAIDASLSAM
jgi:hypothetical protein